MKAQCWFKLTNQKQENDNNLVISTCLLVLNNEELGHVELADGRPHLDKK